MASYKVIFRNGVADYPDLPTNAAFLEACERVMERYPYFPVPYVMKAFAYHLSDELGRWEVLSEAALRVPDRALFRRLLIALVQQHSIHAEVSSDENIDALLRQLGVKDAEAGDFASRAPVAPEAMVSETMARLMEVQGAYDDAIRHYELLKKQNPARSAYFASRIEEIKRKKQSS